MNILKKTNILFILIFLCCMSINCLAEGGIYKFSPEKKLTYNFKIDGDVVYKSAGITGQTFNILTQGLLTLDVVEEKEKTYLLKLVPSEVFIKLNEMVLEQTASGENSVSQMISTSLIEIEKNGRIISVKEVTHGMLNLSQVFQLIPNFPDKLHSGKRWQQTLPSFNLPGIPMCSLNFNYLYLLQNTKKSSKIRLIANQNIKEKKQQKDMVVSHTGKNSSNGEFVFNEERGELESFKGKFNLLLNTVFSTTSTSSEKTSAQQSMPVNIDIKLNVDLTLK